MNEEWFGQMLIEAHNNQRRHLKRILQGLSDDHIAEIVSPNEDHPNIQSLLWHIGSAETYWFYKSTHPIGPRYDKDDLAMVLRKLEENTERIAEVVNTCSIEQLRITPPSPEGGPSVAWALLRTFMHGIYHAGQIAKIRRIISAPDLPPEDVDSWELAVDSVADLIHGLLHDAIQF